MNNITLNVGGTNFTFSRGLLEKYPQVKTDANCLDMDPVIFGKIASFMRGYTVEIPTNQCELEMLKRDAIKLGLAEFSTIITETEIARKIKNGFNVNVLSMTPDELRRETHILYTKMLDAKTCKTGGYVPLKEYAHTNLTSKEMYLELLEEEKEIKICNTAADTLKTCNGVLIVLKFVLHKYGVDNLEFSLSKDEEQELLTARKRSLREGRTITDIDWALPILIGFCTKLLPKLLSKRPPAVNLPHLNVHTGAENNEGDAPVPVALASLFRQ